MKKACFPFCLAVGAILLGIIACVSPNPTPSAIPSSSIPAADASSLWLRTAGGPKADQSWAVISDAQGNLYWGTFQQEQGELYTDMVILKLASNGSLLWETRWGGDYQEKLFILEISPPYLLVGGEQDHSMNIAQADMIVLALDLQDGKVVWEYSYDQGYGYEEVDGLTADGDSIYVSGWTTSKQTGNDVGVLKLNRQGELVWATAWGGPGWDQADGQMVVDEGYIYISGRYDGMSILSGGYGLLAKFRKDTGAYVQHKVWNDRQFYDGYGMASDGAYLYVTGITIVPRAGLPGDGQIFVQKWDKDFNLLWERQWGGSSGDQARAIGVDASGRIVVAGNTIAQDNRQIVLLMYDGQGNLLRETVWGGAQEDVVHGLWIDGEYAYLAGETRSLGKGQNDALLLKVHIPSGSFPPLP